MASTNGKPTINGAGVYRISEDAGRRAADTLHSDTIQRNAMIATAAANGITIADGDWYDETNVSGGTPLEKRPYGQAIDRVEAGELQAILFAYRSRHDRDVIEGAKAIQRMDRAGAVLLVGGTVLTHATPQKWFEATAGSLVSEYQRREIRWNISKGVAEAVAKGRMPGPTTLLGLKLGKNNTVMPDDDPQTLAIVREAFDLRDDGATIDAVRAFLAERGHVRSYRGVQRMLRSPLYVAQMRYGGTTRDDGSITPEYVNDDLGFEPIVDREVWERVQSKAVIRGRLSKSPRLLARQGVILCACGARMIVHDRTVRGKTYGYYRCGAGRALDCATPASVGAEEIEEYVIGLAEREIANIIESESAIREVRDAEAAARAAETKLDDAEGKYMDLGPGRHTRALARLEELRGDADDLRAHADDLRRELGRVEKLAGPEVLRDSDPAAFAAKRELIATVLAGRVLIDPDPRGSRSLDDRITVLPRGQARGAATT